MTAWELTESARVVVAGVNERGNSKVVREGRVIARRVSPNGAVVEELWRQDALPATFDDDGTTSLVSTLVPPATGVAVCRFTLPPLAGVSTVPDYDTLVSVYGADNVTDPDEGPPLHRSSSLLVITAMTGSAYLQLGEGEVLLDVGDSVIMPATFHDWRNPHDFPVMFMVTMFPIGSR